MGRWIVTGLAVALAARSAAAQPAALPDADELVRLLDEALIAEAQGDYEGALVRLRDVAARYPDRGGAQFHLGRFLVLRGDCREGARFLERYLAIGKPARRHDDAVELLARCERERTARAATGWLRPSRWSLAIGAGLGWRDFGNGVGLDHRGATVAIAIGPRFARGRHRALIRAGFEHQGLAKDLDPGTSEAAVDAFGLAVEWRVEVVSGWFTPLVAVGGGFAHYGASEPFVDATVPTGGAEFARNPQLLALDDWGLRAELGAGACTWRGRICATATYLRDVGVDPYAIPFDPTGVRATVAIDVARFAD